MAGKEIQIKQNDIMGKDKLYRLSVVKPRNDEDADSVANARKRRGSRRAFDILLEAQHYWNCMDQFRRDRERAKRYCYGDQWKDLICVDGETMTEEEYISRQGNVPLKNNLIRRLVRNVLGVYRGQAKEPTCYARDRDEQKLGETMTGLLQYCMDVNQMREVYVRTFEEFLIGALVIHRKSYGWRRGRMECWTDIVNPNNFFIDNNMRDLRGWDVSCLGEVHDVSFDELCSEFAETPGDRERLKEIYRYARERDYITTCAERFGYSRMENYDFLLTQDPGRCRVIEVWRKESKPRYRCHDWNTGEFYKIEIEDYDRMVATINTERIVRGKQAGMAEGDIPLIEATWMMDIYWQYYYLSPFGDILREGETPYDHKEHPYTFKAYPFIDGEIHSFVGDVIDQQRYTNRLITLYDFIMRASAKGALLFPEGALPDGMDMDEIAKEWSRFDGIIMYKPKPGVPMPQQISSNSTNIGISELLNLQLKFFEDISGVNGALQGKPGYSGMSAALYNQQTQNATTSLLDLLDSYGSFVKDCALKDVKMIQQYYDPQKVRKIVGRDAWMEIQDVDFDLTIMESTNTPSFRQMANEILLQLWQSQAISVEQLLEHGDFPFADELLQSIRSQKEQLAEGQMPEGLSPTLKAQAQAGADPEAVERAYAMLKDAGAQS